MDKITFELLLTGDNATTINVELEDGTKKDIKSFTPPTQLNLLGLLASMVSIVSHDLFTDFNNAMEESKKKHSVVLPVSLDPNKSAS